MQRNTGFLQKNGKKKKESNMTIENMKKGEWGKIKAFFDIKTDDGFTMKGFKLVEGANGLFAGFPSQKGNDDEYYDTIWADRDLKDMATSLAVKAYKGEDDDGIVEMNLEDIAQKTKEKEELPF